MGTGSAQAEGTRPHGKGPDTLFFMALFCFTVTQDYGVENKHPHRPSPPPAPGPFQHIMACLFFILGFRETFNLNLSVFLQEDKLSAKDNLNILLQQNNKKKKPAIIPAQLHWLMIPLLSTSF